MSFLLLVKIGSVLIGKKEKPYIIAEIGVNYDNSIEYAEELITAAKRAGADAVKFQTYKASKIVAVESPKYWKDEKPDETQYEFFKRSNKFYHEETVKLADKCEEHGITFLSTPFDLDSVDFLDGLSVPAFKIASADITNFPLVRRAAKTGKPILLSTGGSSLGEVERAVRIVDEEEGNENIVLMHCVLAYPTPHAASNLEMIKCLADMFPKYEVGWSDHVIPGNCVIVPTVAVAKGASVIEKHFTTDRTKTGNDHFHSADEELLARMIANIKIAHDSLGEYMKRPLDVEEPARKNARRSIAANKNMHAGEKLNHSNLIMLRPGTGIPPELLDVLVGRKARRDISKGHLITWDDLLRDE